MILSTKLDELKPLVNYDNSSWVRESLEYPYDFIKAVEYALRKVGENVRIMEKTFFLPVVGTQRQYFVDFSALSNAKVDFLKLLDIGIIQFNGNGLLTIGRQEEAWNENIETNQIVDVYELSKKLFGEKTIFKSSVSVDGVTLGKFDSIVTKATNSIRIGTFANAVAGYNVINLERADAGEYSYLPIDSLSDPNLVFVDTVPNSWSTTDKIYICNGLPAMIGLICQCVIQIGYFGDDETMTIPFPAQIMNKLNDFCIKYLYDLLTSRDPKQAEIYATKLKTGLVKTEDASLYDIKKIINASAKIIQTKSYHPAPNSQSYGR